MAAMKSSGSRFPALCAVYQLATRDRRAVGRDCGVGSIITCRRRLRPGCPVVLSGRSGGRSSGVERQLPKLNVVGSNPIARSIF